MITIVEGCKGSGKSTLASELMKSGNLAMAKNYKKLAVPGNYSMKGLKKPGSSLALDYQEAFIRSIGETYGDILCDRGIISLGLDGIYGYFADEESMKLSSYLRMNEIYYSRFLDMYREAYGKDTSVIRLYADEDVLISRLSARRRDLIPSEKFFVRNIDFLVRLEKDTFDFAKSQLPGTAFLELDSGKNSVSDMVRKIKERTEI